MSDIAIKVEGLSKRYLVGHQAEKQKYVALRDVIARNAASLARKTVDMFKGRPIVQGDEVEEFWALKDVSFEIKKGDRVGIIGRNGAGKSTLLKILSRITEPTEGRIQIAGRVASLLEVGTGFHPELTGRENIFLNGAILGMRRSEIQRKFDEIVAFAEVEKFLDTSVKRYSSGMYVRLAFAVAAHLETEILIVDEVLAVGDAQFQKKCLGKMEDVGKEGRTVLFVSHNMAAVQSFCQTGIVLDKGGVRYIGTQFDAISSYLSLQPGSAQELTSRGGRKGTQGVRIVAIEFVDETGLKIESAVSGQVIGIRLHFQRQVAEMYPRLIASIAIRTQLETPVFLQHNRLTGDSFGPLPESGYFELRISKLPLPSATYRITYSLIQDGTYIDALEDAAELIVADGDFYGTGEVPPSSHGLFLCDGRWSLLSD